MPLLEAGTKNARPVRGRGAGLPQLVLVEARKAVDTRSGRALLIVIAALSALVMVFLSIEGVRSKDLGVSGVVVFGMSPAIFFLPVVGILLVTAEWSQRTALVSFALVPDRWRVLLAKVLATLALVVVVALLPLLVVLATAGIVGGDPSVAVDYTGLGTSVASVAISIGCAVLLGLGLAAATLSAPLSIVLVLAVPLIFDQAVQFLPGGVGAYVSSATFPTWASGSSAFDASVVVSLAIWYVAPLVLGFLRYQRTELS